MPRLSCWISLPLTRPTNQHALNVVAVRTGRVAGASNEAPATQGRGWDRPGAQSMSVMTSPRSSPRISSSRGRPAGPGLLDQAAELGAAAEGLQVGVGGGARGGEAGLDRLGQVREGEVDVAAVAGRLG